MIFEAIKTCDDSILISNGKIIKRWDFNGDEIESVNKEVFDSLKQILTFEKIEYNSFDEAKEAFQKYVE